MPEPVAQHRYETRPLGNGLVELFDTKTRQRLGVGPERVMVAAKWQRVQQDRQIGGRRVEHDGRRDRAQRAALRRAG